MTRTLFLHSFCQTHPGTRGSECSAQSPTTEEPRTVSSASSLWDLFGPEELSSCPTDCVVISPMFSMVTSGYADLSVDHIKPILPQLGRDTNTVFRGMGKKAPKTPPVLTPSSPVHWDVKNITRANHCFITNHVLEIGEPLVVRIVKVHLRGSRERKKKKKSVNCQIFININCDVLVW